MRNIYHYLILITLFQTLSATAQQAFYIYRNDSRISTFFTSEVDSLKFSQIDLEGVIHSEYVVQEVFTHDSLYRIPIDVIDSIGFVTPTTRYLSDVRILEGDIRNHVISRTDLTLLFEPGTPNNLLPQVGEKLITTQIDDVFSNAFAGRVSEVYSDEDCVHVICEPVELTEIFETYYGIVQNSDQLMQVKSMGELDRNDIEQKARVINPERVTLDLLNTHSINTTYSPNEELSYTIDNAQASLSVTPTIDYTAYIIVDKNYGVNVGVTATGLYTVEELFSLTGNVNFNFEKAKWKKVIPIPAALMDLEIEIGFFGEATGQISIEHVWEQNYKHVFHWEWSSQSHDCVQGVHDFKNIANSHTGKVALNGSLTAGMYGEIGVAFIASSSLDIAEIGLRYKGGIGIEGTYVPYKKDKEYSKCSTNLYNQIKDVEISSYLFRGLTFGAKLFNWSISKDIPNFLNIPFNNKESWYTIRAVPFFSGTTLQKNYDGTHYATTNVAGNVQSTDIGFALINRDDTSDATYSYSLYNYTGPSAEVHISFPNEPSSSKYTIYPLVKYMDIELIAEPSVSICEYSCSICPDNNHPHVVDLGLPSGIQWSCCNIGANGPSDFGGLYGWGDPSGNMISTDFADYPSNTPPYSICGTEYDIATQVWGSNWQIPSMEDFNELSKYCQLEFTTIDDVSGLKVIGQNGNSIFLPCAGFRSGLECHDVGSSGRYWTGTAGSYKSDRNSTNAYDFYFYDGGIYIGDGSRYCGRSVRPVTK